MPRKAREKGCWASPVNFRKAHFFVDGRSLCKNVMFFGPPSRNQKMGEAPGPDDCRECFRRAKARPEAESGRDGLHHRGPGAGRE